MQRLIQKIKNKRVLVIGDVMLDKYVHGTVDRVSPEAPVPILKTTRTKYKLGGAANVADNISDLGSKAFLCGVVGQDANHNILAELCDQKGINTSYLTIARNVKTTLKMRCVSENHQLLRIDDEQRTPSPSLPKKRFDAVIISDYNKGCITPELMQHVREMYKGIPIIIDPHIGRSDAENVQIFKDCTVLKPNIGDAQVLSGWTYDTEEDLHTIMRALQKKFNTNIVMTLGSKGIAILDAGVVKIIPTQAKEVFDISGAGDTTTAVLALSLTTDASLYEAALLANKAAGLVVEKFGTATVTHKELLDTSLENNKVKNRKEIVRIAAELRKQGKKIVFTNGCFDILHKLHYHLLRDSKKLGDVLIVALNTDAGIHELKGKDRPYVNQKDRAELLSGFECVDYITFFNSHSPIHLIEAIQPSTITKGGDYTIDRVCGAKFVQKHGGEVRIIPYEDGYSTTKLIRRLEENENVTGKNNRIPPK